MQERGVNRMESAAKGQAKGRARPGRLRRGWQEACRHKTSYLLMAPYMVFFILFLVIPIIAAICLSFTYFNMLEAPRFVGLLNYQRLFLEDKIFLKVLQNTLLFAVITGPLSYLLSFGLAWLINQFGRYMRTFMTFLFYAPALMSNMFFMWSYLFSGDSYGVVNGMLLSIGAIREPVQWFSDTSTMLPVLILIQLWASLGTAFLSFIAGFQSQDRTLFEAGAIDGVKNRWQELWYISIPQMAPQLMFGAVMQIGSAFGVSSVIMSLAGWPTTEYAADTIVTYMLDVGNTRYEMGYACTMAVFLFALMLFTNKVITNALRKYSID
ncbi:MAG TPA: sugar ABC transporter permease [Firmicutes bacterium]|nr:sugar ABC transporter permease [Bacillota bacterium]